MELWVTEYQTPSLGLSCKVTATLRSEQTKFQHLAVVDTVQYGRMLLLDGMVQTTDQDEFVYHEMISRVALNSHPRPARVLIIGGGDGGTLREVTKHPGVEKGTLVEIDERVVQASRDFFPGLSASFNSARAEVVIADGIEFVKSRPDSFDVVIVDSTEPVGPARQLFSADFYRNVFRALHDDGMLVVQSESPFLNPDVIQMAYRGIAAFFPTTRLYLASIPTYPSGLWSFTIGSKQYNPEEPRGEEVPTGRYYTPDVHRASFNLPSFVKKILEQVEM